MGDGRTVDPGGIIGPALHIGSKWTIKKPHLGMLVRRARESGRRLGKVSYVHLGREDPRIRRADELANVALDAAAAKRKMLAKGE